MEKKYFKNQTKLEIKIAHQSKDELINIYRNVINNLINQHIKITKIIETSDYITMYVETLNEFYSVIGVIETELN